MAKHELELGFEGHRKRVVVETPRDEPRPWDANSALTTVGKDAVRRDGPEKVSGAATFTHDVRLEGMLYAAVLRCPHACAVVTAIDVNPATEQPGVGAAIALAAAGDRLLFAGQDVAAVAAETPELARDALSAIAVEYDVQPHVVDTTRAMTKGAPQVHRKAVKERRTEGDEPDAGGGGKTSGNVRSTGTNTDGNVEAALKKAATVHEAKYDTQCHTHSALETHGLVVRWDDEKHMTAWASTQSIFSVRDELAELFDLKKKSVRVLTPFMGGGFGAKFGANAPGSALGAIAGELARRANRPVHLMLDRREEHTVTGNRPNSIQTVRIGADAKGRITAIDVKAYGSAGIGTGAGVGRNAYAIYTKVPNRRVDASDVFTNAGPGTAFRAPGHPQGAFAIESAIDELARKMGVDPLELRLQHDEHPLRRYQLELAREKFDWKAKRAASAKLRASGARVRRGYGLAASIWGDYGHPGAMVTVSVERDGDIEVRNGLQDIGGGITTIMAQVAAEVFGQPLERVTVKLGDSDFGPGTGSGGSQTTSTVTPAVRNAAEKVKDQLTDVAAKLLGVKKASKVQWNPDGSAHAGDQKVSWADICKAMPSDAVVATSSRPQTYHWHPMKFLGRGLPQIAGIQVAEVEVDTWTGEVRVPHVLAIHDCGRVMNPLSLRSQINGGVILGTGYALMEQRIMDPDRGLMLNANLEQYKALGARDLPRIEVLITEVATGANSTGAAGIGEPSTIPTAAAIGNALGDALGAHVRSLPLTPDKVLNTLAKGGA